MTLCDCDMHQLFSPAAPCSRVRLQPFAGVRKCSHVVRMSTGCGFSRWSTRATGCAPARALGGGRAPQADNPSPLSAMCSFRPGLGRRGSRSPGTVRFRVSEHGPLAAVMAPGRCRARCTDFATGGPDFRPAAPARQANLPAAAKRRGPTRTRIGPPGHDPHQGTPKGQTRKGTTGTRPVGHPAAIMSRRPPRFGPPRAWARTPDQRLARRRDVGSRLPQGGRGWSNSIPGPARVVCPPTLLPPRRWGCQITLGLAEPPGRRSASLGSSGSRS